MWPNKCFNCRERFLVGGLALVAASAWLPLPVNGERGQIAAVTMEVSVGDVAE
jgi:hypothetical protein